MMNSIKIEVKNSCISSARFFLSTLWMKNYRDKEEPFWSPFIGTERYLTDGDSARQFEDSTYLVLDSWEEDHVLRRIFGEPPATLLSPEVENAIIGENSYRIQEAESSCSATEEFPWIVHQALLAYSKEALGLETMVSRYRPEVIQGRGSVPVLERVVIPPWRNSVPFLLRLGGDEISLMVDVESPDADLYSQWQWYGSTSCGDEVKVYKSRSKATGFDFTRSEWPKEIPVNYSTLRRVVDELGTRSDCCGDYPKLKEGAIRKLF